MNKKTAGWHLNGFRNHNWTSGFDPIRYRRLPLYVKSTGRRQTHFQAGYVNKVRENSAARWPGSKSGKGGVYGVKESGEFSRGYDPRMMDVSNTAVEHRARSG